MRRTDEEIRERIIFVRRIKNIAQKDGDIVKLLRCEGEEEALKWALDEVNKNEEQM